MRDRLYLFFFFIALGLVFWVPGYFLDLDITLVAISLILAHVYGFVGLFFLGLYFKDLLNRR